MDGQTARSSALTSHSPVWMPVRTSIPKDFVESTMVHMMTAETGDAERAQWITNLDTVGALEPTFVVAGHKKITNDNDPKILAESQDGTPERRTGERSNAHLKPRSRQAEPV
jgi:hypothetical protein